MKVELYEKVAGGWHVYPWRDPAFYKMNCYIEFPLLNVKYTILDGIQSTVAEWHFLWSRRSTTKPPRMDTMLYNLFLTRSIMYGTTVLIFVPSDRFLLINRYCRTACCRLHDGWSTGRSQTLRSLPIWNRNCYFLEVIFWLFWQLRAAIKVVLNLPQGHLQKS